MRCDATSYAFHQPFLELQLQRSPRKSSTRVPSKVGASIVSMVEECAQIIKQHLGITGVAELQDVMSKPDSSARQQTLVEQISAINAKDENAKKMRMYSNILLQFKGVVPDLLERVLVQNGYAKSFSQALELLLNMLPSLSSVIKIVRAKQDRIVFPS